MLVKKLCSIYCVHLILILFCYVNLFVNTQEDLEQNDELQNNSTKELRATCTAPDRILNGKVEVKVKGELIELEYVCNGDYSLSPPIVSDHCFRNKWYHKQFPECFPQCKVDYWDESWTACVPECGVRDQPEASVIEDELKLGDFPWHVGLYYKSVHKSDKDFSYLCGGSIIGVQSVITAAYCVSYDKEGTTYDSKIFDLYVAAGKFYNDFHSVLDKLVQKRKVKTIIKTGEYYLYKGLKHNHENDVAIIIVEKPFIYNNVVQPICVDWTDQFQNDNYLKSNHIGYVVGWGDKKFTISSTLKVRLVTYIFRKTIYDRVISFDHKYLTSDKICSNSKKGCNICVGDIGSGLVFARSVNGKTKYFIRGIVSAKGFTNNDCDQNGQVEYEILNKHIDFLIDDVFRNYRNLLYENSTSTFSKSTSCSVPYISNGKLFITGKQYLSTKPIPNHSVVYIECNDNYYLFPPYIEYIICNNGNFNQPAPKCTSKCPPVMSATIDFTCELNGEIKNCAEPSPEGTIVTMICKHLFTDVMSESLYSASVCRNGKWDYPFITCEPLCSHEVSNSQVNIYQNIGVNDTKYICGGSIVTDNLVVTAAHCFTYKNNGSLIDYKDYYLSVAYGVEFQYNISKVEIHKEYKGMLTNFTADIALIVVEPILNITNNARTICIEWNYNYIEKELLSNDTDKRPTYSYGPYYTEKGTDYEAQSIHNPTKGSDQYIFNSLDQTQCKNSYPKEYLTHDKFCVGSGIPRRGFFFANNRTLAACFAGEGSGLITFNKIPLLEGPSKTYLQGVISILNPNDDPCVKTQHYLFTSFHIYASFIRKLMKKYAVCHAPKIENTTIFLSKNIIKPEDPLPNNAIIKIECVDGFQMYPPNIQHVNCKNGVWSGYFPQCLKCGNVKNEEVFNSNNINTEEMSILPWHVAIYQEKNYICGGSLISPKVILTSSKCFSKNQTMLQLAVGKYYKNFNNAKDVIVQTRNFSENDIQFSNDLAAITIKTPFQMNENVQPICIDWNDKFGSREISLENPGIVAFWDLKDNNEDLNYNKFTEVDHEACAMDIKKYFKQILTGDHFCVKSTAGEKSFNDIGSGLIYKKDVKNRFYLRGISTKLSTESIENFMFIRVSNYFAFLLKTLEDTLNIK